MHKQTIMIAISGASGSGKSFMANIFRERISDHVTIAHLSQDWFYKNLLVEERPTDRNWDHPDAFDWDGMKSALLNVKQYKDTVFPTYDYNTHSQTNNIYMSAARVIIFEGIFAMDDRIRDIFDHTIYMDCDQDVAICRRICRDIYTRGRNVDDIVEQYLKQVKPSYIKFIEPTKHSADFIIQSTSNDHLATNAGWKEIIKMIITEALSI